MSGADGGTRGRGSGWLILIAIPPVLIIAGLVAMFVWQVRKGGVTPKWKARTAMTNPVPVTGTAPVPD